MIYFIIDFDDGAGLTVVVILLFALAFMLSLYPRSQTPPRG